MAKIPSEILVPEHIKSLKPYVPGMNPESVRRLYNPSRIVKLASNENPLGVSPLALENARKSLAGMSRYAPGGLALRERLAELHGVSTANVIAGAGSESLIANIIRTFLCDDDEVLTTDAAFQGFQVLAQSRGVAYRTVPYKRWSYDLTALAEAITERTKLIYLANPNNPTGTFFTRHAFEDFHARVPKRVLIILDEAYFEYAMVEPSYPDSLHYRFDNVITLRTFSKVYGLASARVGYGFAHEELIEMLLRVKLPFEPSGIAEAAAMGALEDREFMLHSVANNSKGLALLARTLPEMGVSVIPSAANFVMLAFPSEDQAEFLFEDLLKQGVIVRPLKATGLPRCLRVTVGTPVENEFFLEALQGSVSRLGVDSYVTS